MTVVGLGNELLTDDGIGVRLVRELTRERLPAGITAHEIGTAIFGLPALLAPGRRLLIVDAMRGGGKPGCSPALPYSSTKTRGFADVS